MRTWVVAGVLAGSVAAANAQVPTSAPIVVTPAQPNVVSEPAAATAPNLAASGAGPATARPAGPGGPAGAPGGGAPASAPTLPAEFSILQTRNMFVKGGGKGAKGGGGLEAQFVLKGAVEGGGRFMAFLEEKGSKRVMQVGVGDSIARGKVKGITLDAIEYEAGGATKRIEVGQDLNGQVAPPTPPPATKPAGGAPGGPGQPPPGMGQPGQPGGPGGKRGGAPPGQPQPAPVPESGGQ